MSQIIFSLKEYDSLAKEICQGLKNAKMGALERKFFPDGERYLRISSELKNQRVIIVGSTYSDQAIMELYDLASTVVKLGADRLDICIPYYGYSTMERAVKSGEVVPAKTRARLLSSIPQSRQGNNFHLLDLHSEGIPYYFEGDCTIFHLYAKKAIFRLISKITDKPDFILGSTDAGRAKWVQSLANELNVTPAFVYKKRLSGDKTEVVGINADVKNRDVIIYDDMIRTGGSLIEAAKAYKQAGANSIYAVATHGVLPGDSLIKLVSTGLFKQIGITNSYPHQFKSSDNFLIESIADIFVESLNKN